MIDKLHQLDQSSMRRIWFGFGDEPATPFIPLPYKLWVSFECLRRG